MASHELDIPAIVGMALAAVCVTGLVADEIRHRIAKSRPCEKCKDGTLKDCISCAFRSHVPKNTKPTHSRHRVPLVPLDQHIHT